jgi:hypothetical protein
MRKTSEYEKAQKHTEYCLDTSVNELIRKESPLIPQAKKYLKLEREIAKLESDIEELLLQPIYVHYEIKSKKTILQTVSAQLDNVYRKILYDFIDDHNTCFLFHGRNG